MLSTTLRSLVFAASVTQVFGSCAYNTHLHPRQEGGEIAIAQFGYTGTNGPLNWVALNASANALCSTGKNQSPIDMVAGSFTTIPGSAVTLDIPNFTDAEFENLGSTVEVVGKEGGTLTRDGQTFSLKQFHFHLPSEHLDETTAMPMEMHMVFQDDKTKALAVVGVYVDVAAGAVLSDSKTIIKTAKPSRLRRQAAPAAPAVTAAPKAPAGGVSTLLETVFSKVGDITKTGDITHTGPLDMSEVVNLLKAGEYKTYAGSLTTPPCSEGVKWHVSTQKLTIQPSTFIKVRDVIGFNARFTQNKPGETNLLQLAAGK